MFRELKKDAPMFFVRERYEDGDEFVGVCDAGKIFREKWTEYLAGMEIDMSIWLIGETLRECRYFGTWTNRHDPRRCEIRTEDGEVVAVAYAPDC